MKKIIFFIKPYWHIMLFLSLLMVIKVIVEISFANLIVATINNALHQHISEVEESLFIGVILLVIFTLTNYLYTLTSGELEIKIEKKLRDNIYEHVQKYKLNYFDKNGPGDLISKLNNDISTLCGVLSNNFLIIFLIPLTGLIVFIYLLNLNFKLTIFTALMGPIILILSKIFGNILNKNSQLVYENLSTLNNFLVDSLLGLKEIKIFNLYTLFLKKEKHLNNKIYTYQKKNVRAGSILGALIGIFSNLSFIITIGFGAYLTAKGEISVGVLMGFITLIQYIIDPFISMGDIITSLAESLPSADRVYNLLNNKLFEETKRDEFHDTKSSLTVNKGIFIKNVSFTYNNKNNYTFENLDLFIPANNVTYIIGDNGSGKSTLFHLFLNLYKVDSGEILIDHVNINDINKATLRNTFSLCESSSHLFQCSIKENILYGNPKASMEEIVEAAKLANAHEFIEKLPDKYNTLLMGMENRLNFSSGQKQKILLARAFLKKASVLLVDEATTFLDAESKFQLGQSISKLKQKHTIIIITHDLKNINPSDFITVVDKGKIIERGKKVDLLRKKGFFYQMHYNKVQQ